VLGLIDNDEQPESDRGQYEPKAKANIEPMHL
jgi:hypothetical protein